MPVILTRDEELDTRLSAPWPEAEQLLRPLPDGALRIGVDPWKRAALKLLAS